jgi:hypothetical protein
MPKIILKKKPTMVIKKGTIQMKPRLQVDPKKAKYTA